MSQTVLVQEDDLRTQLLRESLGMARFALSRGHVIPVSVAKALESATKSRRRRGRRNGDADRESQVRTSTRKVEPAETGYDRCMIDELEPVQSDIPELEINTLVAVHEKLVRIVAPATPQAILLLGHENGRPNARWIFGSIPLVRQMMIAAFLSLTLFISMALFPEVTGDISFVDAESWELLLNLLFLLAAAGLGASFDALFQINRFIADVNFDPKYNVSYWIRFTLGLIAGLIIAELIPIGEIGAAANGGGAGGDGLQSSTANRLGKPTLALLGGFSATVVFRLLSRFVAAVDTLVRGDTREILAAQQQAAKARLSEQVAQHQAETLSGLIALQQQIRDGASSEAVQAGISGILDNLTGQDLPPSHRQEAPSADRVAPPPGLSNQKAAAVPH